MKMIKRIIISITAVFLTVISVSQVFAETIYEYYGISYVIVSNTEVSVVGWDNRSSALTIPNQINGRNVISAGNGAFEGNSFLTSVDFSSADSFNRIGAYAFQNCTGLYEPLLLTKSITKIENRAFQNCSSLPSVTVNSNIIEIPTQCFNGCSALTEAVLSEGIERINAWAFADCTSLEYLNIPQSVSYISDYAFNNDDKLVLGVYNNTYSLQYAENKRIDHIIHDSYVYGDVNGDGAVDILDSTEIQKFAAEKAGFTDEQFNQADINQDGYADVLDALIIQKFVVGQYDIPKTTVRY